MQKSGKQENFKYSIERENMLLQIENLTLNVKGIKTLLYIYVSIE